MVPMSVSLYTFLSFTCYQAEIRQLQKELSKTKSSIVSMASNVAESVTVGLDGVRVQSMKELDRLNGRTSLDVPESRETREHSPFKHKKEKEGPVQLLSFRRKSLS